MGGTADRRPAVDPTALPKEVSFSIPPFLYSIIALESRNNNKHA